MFATKIYNKFIKVGVLDIWRRQMSTSNEFTHVVMKDGIKSITMCHGKTRNALSIQMMETLLDNITKTKDDPSMRVIVITHTGPVFSSGHNLHELSCNQNSQQHKRVFSLASSLMMAIIESPVPVIARVNGLAAAAGCQLMAQCDIALCTRNSTFSTPGANYGIFCSTPGIALGRSVGKNIALEMLLTGLPLSSRQAHAAGLVNKVCNYDTLDVNILRICNSIMWKSRSVIEKGKRFFYQQMQLDIKAAYSLGEKIMADSCSTTDGKEGIISFIEKRKPLWTNLD